MEMSRLQYDTALSLLSSLVTNTTRETESDENQRRQREEDTKSILIALETLVGGKLMDKALAVVRRRGSVMEFKAQQSERRMYRVCGESETYKVLVPVGYCSCVSFTNRMGTTMPLCKHILAVYFALAENAVGVTEVDDKQWGSVAWT